MKEVIICSDRDGTINVDNRYYLGKSPHWKSQLDFLPGVIEGIKLLNTIKNSAFYIVTNQSGVAIASDLNDAEFPNLDEQRMHEVNECILKELAARKALVDGYFACPYVTSKYAEKARAKGRTIHPEYISDCCRNLKPEPGMLKMAAESSGWTSLTDGKGFMLGDRITDIETALNAGWTGILVIHNPLVQEEDIKKTQELILSHRNRVYLCNGFLEAAKLIQDKVA